MYRLWMHGCVHVCMCGCVCGCVCMCLYLNVYSCMCVSEFTYFHVLCGPKHEKVNQGFVLQCLSYDSISVTYLPTVM